MRGERGSVCISVCLCDVCACVCGTGKKAEYMCVCVLGLRSHVNRGPINIAD
jgi:hypothetical protein